MRLDIVDLVHEYTSGLRALDGVHLSIEGSDPVAIIGQNGAGKTTLVKHCNGILQATSGKVLVDGIDIRSHDTAYWSSRVGYVFQNPDDQLFLESVREEFVFGPHQIGMSSEEMDRRLEWIADLVGLSRKLDEHPFDLSLTEKKFCTIGSVIMMNPKIIIFDEPTCGQDVPGKRRLHNIITTLREQGTLCITISHDMKFVTENFSRVVVMSSGKVLLDGETRKVFAQQEQLKQAFVTPPPITRAMHDAGLPTTVFSVDECIQLIEQERNIRG